jgi:hypothetical protein
MKLAELMKFIDSTNWQSNDKEVVIVMPDDPEARYAVGGCRLNAAEELEILVA